MSLSVWIIYLVTVIAVMSIPGPSQLLMLTNSSSHGIRRALSTAAGDICANILQMLAAGLGLAAVMSVSGTAFAVIKWVGVAYLIWLGIHLMSIAKTVSSDIDDTQQQVSLVRLWAQGMLTSAANPKEIGFFAALFPQFISSQVDFWPQFLILSATYIVLDISFLLAYGIGANWALSRFGNAEQAWVGRAGGSCMIVAAILMGFGFAA
ncbi:MAG: LysE family transporter [Pseudomonadota bacterium]